MKESPSFGEDLVAAALESRSLEAKISDLGRQLVRRLGARLVTETYADFVLARSTNSILMIEGERATSCPDFRGCRYSTTWEPDSRALFHHCFQPSESQVSRRFMEQFILPDLETTEWLSHVPYRQIMNFPLHHGGIVFGKVMAFCDGPRRGWRERNESARDVLAELAPLLTYRALLRDLLRLRTDPMRAWEVSNRIAAIVEAGTLHSARFSTVLPASDLRCFHELAERLSSQKTVRAAAEVVRVLVAAQNPFDVAAAGAVFIASGGAPIRIVGNVGSAGEALLWARRIRPDVVVWDSGLPPEESLRAIARLTARRGGERHLLIVERATASLAGQAAAVGLRACITREGLPRELPAAVQALHAGRTFYSEAFQQLIGASSSREALTPRELEILQRVRAGKSSKEIAQALSLSARTVENHLYRIFRKLRVRSRTEAVAAAVRCGLLLR